MQAHDTPTVPEPELERWYHFRANGYDVGTCRTTLSEIFRAFPRTIIAGDVVTILEVAR